MAITRLGPFGYPVAAYAIKAYVLQTAPGSYVITGKSALLIKGSVLNAGPGSYTITGKSALLIKGSILPASAGSYIITGYPALLTKGFVLSASPGQYKITGKPANLVVNPPINNLVRALGDWLSLSRRWRYDRDEPMKPLDIPGKRKKSIIAKAKAVAAQPIAAETPKPRPVEEAKFAPPPVISYAAPTVPKPAPPPAAPLVVAPKPAIIPPSPEEDEAAVMEALTALMPVIRQRLNRSPGHGRTRLR